MGITLPSVYLSIIHNARAWTACFLIKGFLCARPSEAHGREAMNDKKEKDEDDEIRLNIKFF